MIDILVYLFENYQDLSTHPKPDALARKLSAIGFEDEDISLALVWLNGLKNSRPAAWSSGPLSQRVYTAEEHQP
jgi:Smg protein